MFILLGIVGGFIALIGGGELLVRGASNLAAAARVSPLIIGLTVVAFGTSAPELAVALQSCYAGKTGLAVGNAVGSNISNLLLILGISALAAPLAVNVRMFRIDIPAMIVAAVLLWVFGLSGSISRIEGLFCCVLLVAYFTFTIRQGRRESAVATSESLIAESEITYDPRTSTWGGVVMDIVKLVIGLALLVGGANLLVDACVKLAQGFGVSDLVIGLTVVAIGTSLPELVTSLMASLRGQRDLAVGNVVGSNILNILLVLGLSAMVAPTGIAVDAQSMHFDIPFLIVISLAAVPIFFSGFGITRIEGGAMLLYYVAYLAYLVWHAGRPAGTVTPISELLMFLAPIVPLVVLVILFRPRKTS
ncbi:calcium/sodium antiporter [Aeoliella sp. ICT_H6.2]|uniref:Calcium/sodium antiporter n=1 Tax=Aeoliella straminimaris TaxID=2954799 RepID=A0A9X2JJ58_9BACT|nr:calcium/sodium antiporter [Aeoliella straminimaris]MCO6047516.1 calcium/sodium antiporter [Aeoliella straminimaris]